MKLPGVKTAQTLSRWLQARILGGALILGYHRVVRPVRDPYDVCVSPENFAEQLEILHKFTRPVSLSRLVNCLRECSLVPGSVAVTFDDGYVDNLSYAKPLLERYDIPATVFVCTGYPGREFWWDELERLVSTSNADLPSLRLEVGKRRFHWDPPAGRLEAALPEMEQRDRFHSQLYLFLLELDVPELLEALDRIRDWAGMAAEDNLPARALDHTELIRLSQGGLVEVGAHTQNHLMLPRLSRERQTEEIVSSKRTLEAVLNRPVAGFAYPNGRSTAETKQIVKEAGFSYACTSLENVVRPASDLYGLSRFWQNDRDGESFLRGLNHWMRISKIWKN